MLLLVGCSEDQAIVNNVDERDANEIIVFLASKGIESHKMKAVSCTAAVGGGDLKKKLLTALLYGGVGAGIGGASGLMERGVHGTDINQATDLQKQLQDKEQLRRYLGLYLKDKPNNKSSNWEATAGALENQQEGREESKELASPDNWTNIRKKAPKKEEAPKEANEKLANAIISVIEKRAEDHPRAKTSWQGVSEVAKPEPKAEKPQGGGGANAEEMRKAKLKSHITNLLKIPTKPQGGSPANKV